MSILLNFQFNELYNLSVRYLNNISCNFQLKKMFFMISLWYFWLFVISWIINEEGVNIKNFILFLSYKVIFGIWNNFKAKRNNVK